MSDDKTRQDGDDRPEADPVADDEVIVDLEDQFDEDSSEDGAEDTDRDGDDDATEEDTPGKADRKTSKVVTRRTAKAPVKKTSATKKRPGSGREEHDPYRAKNPVQFVRQSVAELKKVVWPSWGELTVLFSAVLLFVLFIIAYVLLLDYGFGQALLSLFGGNPSE